MFGEATGQLTATTAIHTASSQVAQHQTYGYDLVGKLLSRAWKATPGNAATTDVSETFTYDGLNRLTASTIGQSVKSLTYSAVGNITYKSDVGTYLYGNSAKPHALTATSGLINATYTYDANGNSLPGAADSRAR